ncbi:hypothetical protein [Nonomuraea roseoviolacea]|uniref:Uncharacterized protein n=1 Tax=Nonomuraea roseoviolacea subsp. carminata TaxID=160689 RepID=A0ABT1JXK7_9ACTN|nr:hypothetical protein [Nonomuraea roseoviolacea]MCP2346330.1 hypothetical protein [Nonomuraea roseoviolacea subsp. carminata]
MDGRLAETGHGLRRLDSIVSVSAILLDDRGDPRWEEMYPDRQIREARRVRIMVAGPGGSGVRVDVSWPVRAARDVSFVENPPGAGEKRSLYVHGHRRSWGGNAQIWRIAEQLPDPDWPAVRP